MSKDFALCAYFLPCNAIYLTIYLQTDRLRCTWLLGELHNRRSLMEQYFESIFTFYCQRIYPAWLRRVSLCKQISKRYPPILAFGYAECGCFDTIGRIIVQVII